LRRSGEIDHRSLGRIVRRHVWKADLAGVRGDVDDRAALTGEGAIRGLSAVHNASDIDLKLAAPSLGRNILRRDHLHDAGIIHPAAQRT
jgi:hypothetical protein